MSRTHVKTGRVGIARRVASGLLVVAMGAASGCSETDAWLFDPSVVGRWEHTPTRVPVLSRLASIEGPEDEFLEYSDVTQADLVPEVAEYRIGPGDGLTVTVFDIPEEGRPTQYDRLVDTRGFVEIPQLGQIYVGGMTSKEAAEAIKAAMNDLIAQPLAFVVVASPRLQRFSIFGAVQRPGQYQIPVADYRLLEALTAAEGFSESPEYIYIIRQVPLSDATRGRQAPPPAGEEGTPSRPDTPPLPDLIKQLSDPAAPGPTGATGTPAPTGPNGSTGPRTPPIDLIDPGRSPEARPAAAQPGRDATGGTWVNIQGRWVKVRPQAIQGPNGERGAPGPATVAQRVIRIPTTRVAVGDARYNVVIRPGDVIRVPPSPSGLVFLSGQVARPGAFGMSERLTLTRLIASAGGLSAIAIPERVDIVRFVGPEEQGFVRVNLKAIHEGTHPDIFIKPNDHVNVGTNFWATPMAVIRNGFRASYGFGFIVDRNFGNDLFGAPPANAFGQ